MAKADRVYLEIPVANLTRPIMEAALEDSHRTAVYSQDGLRVTLKFLSADATALGLVGQPLAAFRAGRPQETRGDYASLPGRTRAVELAPYDDLDEGARRRAKRRGQGA